MKKILILLLTVAISLSCFISCSYLGDYTDSGTTQTTEEKVYFITPEDEQTATKTFSQTNEDGLKLEVMLHGYTSESSQKDFYVKNNEYFLVDVKLTNESQTTFYQYLPTACRGCSPAHNHEIGFDIANGDYKLHSSSFGFVCPEMTETWEIKPGQSYEWQLKLAAGKPLSYSVSTYPSNTSKDNEKEKEDSVDYEFKSTQSGNVQFYESTFAGIYFGSGGSLDTNSSMSTFYAVVDGSAITIAGLLPSDFDSSQMIRLYEEAIYNDHLCTFEGPLSFSYMKSDNEYKNAFSVSVPLSIDVVYVSPIPATN